MWLYIIIFIVVAAAYIITSENEKFSPLFFSIILMSLGLFVALGDMLGGYDRYIYGELFDHAAEALRRGMDISNTSLIRMYGKEYSYVMLNLLIGAFSPNRYVFIFIFTIIIYVLLLVSFLKYTNRSPFVLVLFLGLWFFFTFTYLRQVMAVAVSWLAIQYAIERKLVPFFLIIAIALGFHNSAIVLVPIYFIPMKKMNKLWIFGILIICLILGSTGLPDALFGSFGEITEQQQRINVYAEKMQESGFRFAYILESAVFLILLFNQYDKINDENKGQVMMLNMSFVFIGLLLFFIRSNNGGRMTWYYMIGIISTFNIMVTKIRHTSIYSFVMLVMCAMLYLRILFSWGALGTLYPYKSILSDGHRKGDWVWETWEYDVNYDTDHFYK